MIRVYTDMAADLFHVGHLNLIKRAKEHGDYLIVGIHSDSDIAKYKRKPIIPDVQRYQIVEACNYVDEVIRCAPLLMSKEFILENKIDVIVRGDDITEAHLKQQAAAIEMGIMKYLPRTEGVSTTDIIDRIREEYQV